MEKKPISYTSYSTYVTCAYKWFLHYKEKLRPESQPSHLIFGSATDTAMNHILSGGTKEEALALCCKDLQRLFTEKVNLETKDFDSDLIDSTDEHLREQLKSIGWTGSDLNVLASSLFQRLHSGSEMSVGQTAALNWLVYFSFKEKIGLIIDGYKEHVEPMITEVVSVQKNVKRGILDFEAKFEGIEGIVTCDNKTASRPYEPDAVKMSVQLAGYGAEKGAYIVFDKNVKKNRTKVCSVCGNDGTGKRHKTCDSVVENVRCDGAWDEFISPEIVPQIIIDDVPARNREIVEQAYQDVETLIEANVFPRNLTACGKQFGKPCPYIDKCWQDKEEGLKRESK